MKFSELMSLKYNEDSDKISINELKEYVINIPNEIRQEFLSDHGRKNAFQKQYSHLN